MYAALFAAATALCAQAAEKQSILYNFNTTSGGYLGVRNLVMDKSGNLYGTAGTGGISATCCGTVFELSPKSGGGWIYSVIYVFTGSPFDAYPVGSLAIDASGNLYGSTSGYSMGEIFELTPDGSGGWTKNTLGVTGPEAGFGAMPLILDAAGNIYGANELGGKKNYGYVFKGSRTSGGGWTFEHLHDFGGPDGANPVGGLAMDASGNLYGTTYAGGTSLECLGGCGTVFELTQQAGTWNYNMIHEFDGTNGTNPRAPVTIDAAGNLYGTASIGGSHGLGLVFELTLVSGVWQPHVLHGFSGANGDGSFPDRPVVISGGNLYGTTAFGGGGLDVCASPPETGCGSVFELSPSGSTWKQTILHDFTGGGDGAFPTGVIIDSTNKLYGATFEGGSSGVGVVYELFPSK
jgi:uncharacterized repeat protein (TIGR03803 family)